MFMNKINPLWYEPIMTDDQIRSQYKALKEKVNGAEAAGSSNKIQVVLTSIVVLAFTLVFLNALLDYQN